MQLSLLATHVLFCLHGFLTDAGNEQGVAGTGLEEIRDPNRAYRKFIDLDMALAARGGEIRLCKHAGCFRCKNSGKLCIRGRRCMEGSAAIYGYVGCWRRISRDTLACTFANNSKHHGCLLAMLSQHGSCMSSSIFAVTQRMLAMIHRMWHRLCEYYLCNVRLMC